MPNLKENVGLQATDRQQNGFVFKGCGKKQICWVSAYRKPR